ncbi:MAG: endonuclease III [Gammaproteobacteria bacterium]|nr:endonuclease III [Gammaproteobacteria bacterium]
MTDSLNQTIHILELFKTHYADVKIALDYETPFQLLVAVMLSAQCTDKAVNKVTKDFFQEVKQAEDLLSWTISDLEKTFAPLGLFRMKARAVYHTARDIVERFDNAVPSTIQDLISLQGVGKKTASVVANELYDHHVIAVDTHVFRVTQRIGLVEPDSDRNRIADRLNQVVPFEYRLKAHHWFIAHGRLICQARKPKCHGCFLAQLCPSAQI